MRSTLTDRYVWAVTRQLPSDQRHDIEAELRSTISDMSEVAGERGALVELGDPALLAASYRSGGRVLIGEVLYPEYIRQLRRWLAVVVPILSALAAVGAALGDDPTVGSVVVGALGGAATAVVQVSFWVTVVFALIERFGPGESSTDRAGWDPDDLEDVPAEPQVGLTEAVGEVVITLILISVLFIQRSWSPVQDADGDSVPVLDPDLWLGPMWAAIALLIAGAAVVVIAHLRGAWSWPLATATAAIDLALFALVAWAAFSEQLVNPAFLAGLSDDLDRTTALTPSPIVITVVAGALLLWDACDALRSAGRPRGAVA